MGIFRKRETYNEQMLHEAGLDRVVFNTLAPGPAAEPEVPTAEPRFPGLRFASAGGVRPSPWDVTATVTVAGIEGDHAEFTVLPDGDLIVTDETGDADLSPFADAIEERLAPPYKAIASRQDGGLWGVGAKHIEVVSVVFAAADALVLSKDGGVTELHVDGEASDAAPPVALQRLGERIDGDFCIQASRIDGDWWEVKVSPL